MCSIRLQMARQQRGTLFLGLVLSAGEDAEQRRCAGSTSPCRAMRMTRGSGESAARHGERGSIWVVEGEKREKGESAVRPWVYDGKTKIGGCVIPSVSITAVRGPRLRFLLASCARLDCADRPETSSICCTSAEQCNRLEILILDGPGEVQPKSSSRRWSRLEASIRAP